MRILGEIELKGIKQIVINRTIVWQREQSCDCTYCWKKIKGGEGFNPINHPAKTNQQMMSIINNLLNRRTPHQPMVDLAHTHIPLLVRCPCEKRAYRCWQSEATLNIVRKDLP